MSRGRHRAPSTTGRRVLRPEVVVVLSMALQAFSATLFALVTARWLGPSDRGIIVLAATTASLLMLAGSLGTATGGRIMLGQQNRTSVTQMLRASRPLVFGHWVTSAVVGAIIFGVSGSLRGGATLIAFVPYSVLMLWVYLRREALHGIGLHRSAVLGDTLCTALQTVGACSLYALNVLNVYSVFGVMILGLCVQVLFQSRLIRHDRTDGQPIAFKRLVRFSIPAMSTALGQAFVIRGDRLVLGVLAASSAVGIYGSAASLTESLWLVAGGVGQVLFRKASLSGEAPKGRVRPAVMLLTTLGVVVLWFAAEPIIRILLGPEYLGGVPMVRVLAVASIPMASYQLDVAILSGLGILKRASLATAAGSICLLVPCLILIPKLGAMGAGWSSLFSYTVMAGIARYFVVSHRPQPADLADRKLTESARGRDEVVA